jgi:hypothetical protein
MLKRIFYNESLLGNITYLNCMDLYADEEGFMKTELLNEKDSHVVNKIKSGELNFKSDFIRLKTESNWIKTIEQFRNKN